MVCNVESNGTNDVTKFGYQTISQKSYILNSFKIFTIFFQILMCILINTSVLSTGMGLGFPAVTISALKNDSSSMALTESEVTWFGK